MCCACIIKVIPFIFKSFQRWQKNRTNNPRYLRSISNSIKMLHINWVRKELLNFAAITFVKKIAFIVVFFNTGLKCIKICTCARFFSGWNVWDLRTYVTIENYGTPVKFYKTFYFKMDKSTCINNPLATSHHTNFRPFQLLSNIDIASSNNPPYWIYCSRNNLQFGVYIRTNPSCL